MFRSKCPQTTVWRDHEYRKNEPVSTWSEERSPAALPQTPLQYMAWTTLTKAWYRAVAAMTRVTSFFTFVGVFAYHAPDPEGRISSHLPRAWLSIVHPRACLSYPIPGISSAYCNNNKNHSKANTILPCACHRSSCPSLWFLRAILK